MLRKKQPRSDDSVTKKQFILILLLLSALFGVAGICHDAGQGREPVSPAILAECAGESAQAGSFLSPDRFPPDGALLSGGGGRTLQTVRSGGTVRTTPTKFQPTDCEVVRIHVGSVSERRRVVPIPDLPPQILLWLASALEIRAGPIAVRIG